MDFNFSHIFTKKSRYLMKILKIIQIITIDNLDSQWEFPIDFEACSSRCLQKPFVFWLGFRPVISPSLVMSRKWNWSLLTGRNLFTGSFWWVGSLCNWIKISQSLFCSSSSEWILPVFGEICEQCTQMFDHV